MQKTVYEIFFKTYTEKVWGIPCSEIRADWAAQSIKGLSLIEAVKNALFGNRGNKVKSLIDEFAYPRQGPGMLWEALEKSLTEKGHPVLLNREVREIRHS